MSYLDPLSFSELRVVNSRRCEEIWHPITDWSETDWSNAMCGEAGETANKVKKRRRGESVPVDVVMDELADVIIYADLLATRLGADLGEAVRRKFNEKSRQYGSKYTL